MIDYENIRNKVVDGLEEYLKKINPKCEVQRSNQDHEPPSYPYVSYTITTLQSENKGTWQVHEDGIERKAITQTWSITILSDDNTESILLASKAREWLDHTGTTYLNDNDIIVQSVTAITNRDNILTNGYEYRQGFDCFLWLYDEVENPIEEIGYIETVEFQNN